MNITFLDLIKKAENDVSWLERSIPRWKVLKPENGLIYDKQLEVARGLLRLLKKHKKEPQGNLFDQFEKMK